MKKRELFLLMIIFISNLNAQTSLQYKVGMNLSYFRTSDSYLKPGNTLGIAEEWHQQKSVSYVGELLFTTAGGILKDKTIMSDFSHNEGTKADIRCNVGFAECNLFYKYYLSAANKAGIYLMFGPSLHISLFGKNKLDNQDYINLSNLDEDDRNKFKFDYQFIDEPERDAFLGSSGIGFYFCIGTQLSDRLLFELRYDYSFMEIGTIDTLELNEEYNSIHLIVGIGKNK